MKFKNQKEMFLHIWQTRPHVCFVTGAHLGDEPLAQYFAHVLPKGSYPKYKLNPDNIVLLTFKTHQQYDQGNSKDQELFKRLHDKKDHLKREYYKEYYGKTFD